jgi:hypothetical protein
MTSPTFTLDPATIQQLVEQAVQEKIIDAVEKLSQDPVWLEKIERQINQAVVQRTVAALGSVDINPVVKDRVDENMKVFRQEFLNKFSSTGISDQSTQLQLTIMDETTVIENELTARDLNITNSAVINDLTVKGSINTNNRSWDNLADTIAEKTLARLGDDWRDSLVQDVAKTIQQQGIDFDHVNIQGNPLVVGNSLSRAVTESNLQSVGVLKNLQVSGEASLYNTVHVVNHRLGVNTKEPEMALSVWDEEVSIIIGKNKIKQAYIGTSRDQGLVIGVNRLPQIEIDVDGLTTVKKLRVGVHRIGHEVQVPGYAGTRGDIVFSSDPGPDRTFAWVCLGGHKWQTLKSAE